MGDDSTLVRYYIERGQIGNGGTGALGVGLDRAEGGIDGYNSVESGLRGE